MKQKTIGIVAPSSPTKEERINKGTKKLNDLGYKVVYGKSVNKNYLKYLSGSDQVRSSDINEMFLNPDIDMIICQNGGYGTPRIIQDIDFEMIKDHKKVFSGFSDITLLLNSIYMNTGLTTYHGPMLAVDFSSEYQKTHIDSFFNAINKEEYIIKDPKMTAINKGKTEGILVGGNLSLLNVFIALDIKDFFKDKILLIEEVKEANYRLDRMLHTLKIKGVFDDLNGIIIGGITGEETPQKGSLSLFEDILKEYDYPIIFNAPIGHVTPRYTVPIGGRVMLDSDNLTITILGE